jgi:adenylate cyclase
MPRLVIKGKDNPKTIVPIQEENITIGKNEPGEGIQNIISLDDDTVSRRHARIFKEGENYFIEDLRSTNHTFVNGKEIKKAKLNYGDRIIIGLHTLIFEAEEADHVNPSDLVVQFQELDKSKTIDLNYLILHQISDKLATATDLEEFLESVMDTVCSAIQVEKGLLLLLGDDGEFHCHVIRGEDASYDQTVVEKARYEKKAFIDFSDVSPFEVTLKTRRYRIIPSIMCAPIIKYGEVIGVIYIEDSSPVKYSREDLTLLTTVANHISSSIEKVILSERIKKEVTVRDHLGRFLPPHLASKITKVSMDTGKTVLEAERFYGTILFLHAKDLSRISETLDPVGTAELLNTYFNQVVEIIFKYEGTLSSYIGDRLTAIFGAPISYPDHAKNAVLAAIELQEEQRKYKDELDPNKRFDIRIGIDTGEVIAGYIGPSKRTEYVVLGNTVIIANRLGLLAEPGSILISRQTHELVKTNYRTQFARKMKAPQGEEEIEIYRILKQEK